MSEIELESIQNTTLKATKQFKEKLLSLILSGRPKKKEIRQNYDDFDNGYDTGFNQAIDEYDNWIKECLK